MRTQEERITVGVPALLEIMHVLEGEGYSIEALQRELAYAPQLLLDPDGRVPLHGFMRGWHVAMSFLAPARITAFLPVEGKNKVSPLPELLAAGDSLIGFLQRRARHAMLINPALSISVRTIDDEVELRLQTPEIWARRYPGDEKVWGMLQLYMLATECKHLYPGCEPRLVRSQCVQPELIELFQQTMQIRVFPDPAGHSIRFRRDQAMASVYTSDPTTHLLDEPAIPLWNGLANRLGIQEIRQFFEMPGLPAIAQFPPEITTSFAVLAQAALRSTLLSTLELSLMFGFPTHQHFSRTFRYVTGVLPRVWRRSVMKQLQSTV